MPAKRNSQAIEALEEHMCSGHDIDQPAQLANTLALLSIAESLYALVEIGIDATGSSTSSGSSKRADSTPPRLPRSPK